MIEDDIELVRRAYEEFDLRAPNSDLVAEDFVYKPSVTGSETVDQLYVGQAGWRKYQQAALEVWSSLTLELHNLRSLRPGVVLSKGELHAVGRSSGAPVTMPHHAVVQIQEGRIADLRVFRTLDAALGFAATIPAVVPEADSRPASA